MAILDTLNASSSSSNAAQSSALRQKAKVWLNVGYEKNGKFISLPLGLPIDTMEKAEVRGQNEEWLKTQKARNNLLEALQTMANTMQPGEEKEVNLTLVLRRTQEDAVTPADDDNEFTTDFSALFATK